MAPIDTPERVNILGVGLSVLNLQDATRRIQDAAALPGFLGYVTVTGVHGVIESQGDEELQRIHNRSFLSTPDGMPMVWLGKMAGHSRMDRVYGPDLMEMVIENSPPREETHYFFGGGEGLADELKNKLVSRFLGLKVVGADTPPFRPLTLGEKALLANQLQQLKPHYLWIGLSTPKQEKFMAGFVSEFPELTKDWDHGMVLLGVGAAFDFHAGRITQAPRWIQRSGLEWAFRMCMEPRRLFKRYAKNNPMFLGLITLQKLRLKSFEMLV